MSGTSVLYVLCRKVVGIDASLYKFVSLFALANKHFELVSNGRENNQ